MDLVTVSVDAVVYYRVEDPVRAETEIEESRLAGELGSSIDEERPRGRAIAVAASVVRRMPLFLSPHLHCTQ